MARYDPTLRKQLFDPEFCFVDIDDTDKLPKFAKNDRPKSDCDEFVRLNIFYGGDLATKQLYKVGTDLDGFVYRYVTQ